MAADDFDGRPAVVHDQRVCNGILADLDRIFAADADHRIIAGSRGAERGPVVRGLPIVAAAIPDLGGRNSADGFGYTLVLARIGVGHDHLQRLANVGLNRRVTAGMAYSGPVRAAVTGNLPGVAEPPGFGRAAVTRPGDMDRHTLFRGRVVERRGQIVRHAEIVGAALAARRVRVGHDQLQLLAFVGFTRRIAAGMANGGPVQATIAGILPGVAEPRRYRSAAVGDAGDVDRHALLGNHAVERRD